MSEISSVLFRTSEDQPPFWPGSTFVPFCRIFHYGTFIVRRLNFSTSPRLAKHQTTFYYATLWILHFMLEEMLILCLVLSLIFPPFSLWTDFCGKFEFSLSVFTLPFALIFFTYFFIKLFTSNILN